MTLAGFVCWLLTTSDIALLLRLRQSPHQHYFEEKAQLGRSAVFLQAEEAEREAEGEEEAELGGARRRLGPGPGTATAPGAPSPRAPRPASNGAEC